MSDEEEMQPGDQEQLEDDVQDEAGGNEGEGEEDDEQAERAGAAFLEDEVGLQFRNLLIDDLVYTCIVFPVLWWVLTGSWNLHSKENTGQ